MAMFRYTAKNARGEDTAGAIDASSLAEALEQLLERGLQDVQVTRMRDDFEGPVPAGEGLAIEPAELAPTSPFAQPPVSLSASDASELAGHVAQISVAKMPLASGLRAAAEETASRRVSLALQWIADQVDQGRSLDDTLTHCGKLLPTYVSGLILAAARTGRLGEALYELVEQQQAMRAVHHSTRSGFSYVLFVLIFSVAVLTFIGYYVTGVIGNLLRDFGLKLPLVTELLFWWRDRGAIIVGCAILAIVLLAAAYRVLAGRARWERLIITLPLFGGMWQSTAVADWSGLLSVLLRHDIPLPDALRMAGHGICSAHVGSVSLRLADGVARGRQLSQLMFSQRAIPSSLIPLVEWGEQSGALSESFRIGREMYGKRAVVRAALIQAVVPPLAIVGIGCVVLFIVFGLYSPLLNLISALS